MSCAVGASHVPTLGFPDGSVKAITHEQVVFSQDVNDPLSLVKQREVAKPVRPAEGRG